MLSPEIEKKLRVGEAETRADLITADLRRKTSLCLKKKRGRKGYERNLDPPPTCLPLLSPASFNDTYTSQFVFFCRSLGPSLSKVVTDWNISGPLSFLLQLCTMQLCALT